MKGGIVVNRDYQNEYDFVFLFKNKYLYNLDDNSVSFFERFIWSV